MSEPRFYCEDLTPGVVELDADESRHALQVLRLRGGNEIILFDGCGRMAHGRVQPDTPTVEAGKPRRGGGKGGRVARVKVERVLCEPLPTPTLTLVVAGCKGARLTWMVEKLTELGTTGITIAEFERSVVHVGKSHEAKLRRTALEACKQCQRVWMPEIRCGVALAEAVPASSNGPLLVAHLSPDAPSLASALHGRVLAESGVTAVVGPEGGLTDGEVELLLGRSGRVVRIAPHVLRVETAAVAVAAAWAAHLPG